jgi:hypothetical protein
VTATVTVWGAPARSPHIAQIAASSFDASQVAADHSVSRNAGTFGVNRVVRRKQQKPCVRWQKF